MSLFVCLLLPVVLSLGLWQLERAEEKRLLETAYVDQLAALPVRPTGELEDFQRVRLEGTFEAGRDFLLDNQTRQGRIGYGVVTPLLADDGRRWLINRGFVAGDARRERLPEFRTPQGPVTVIGVVWPELGLMPLLAEDPWGAGWPKRVQRLEVERMAGLLDGAVAREIRLEAGQPGVLLAPLLSMNMPEDKHLGYAMQWFGLAAALCVGFLLFGYRKHD
jgi:cytochrome oxidase assembly protein ShyY1